MKKVIKILILMLVFVLAVFFAASCRQECDCGDCHGDNCAAHAATAGLYVYNDPSNPGGTMYSYNGIDFNQITGDPVAFVNAYYTAMPAMDSLNLWFGEEGKPIVTDTALHVIRDTQAEINIQNSFASSLDPLTHDYEELIAGSSAVVLSGSADLTIYKGYIITDGVRAITQSSTGTLTISGELLENYIYDTMVASSGAVTVYLDNVVSSDPAYIQFGAQVLNNSDSNTSSVLYNASGRNVIINGGFLAGVPATYPYTLAEEEYGYGRANVIRNLYDGAIFIDETDALRPLSIVSINTVMGVISLEGDAPGKTVLTLDNGYMFNANEDVLLSSTSYFIFSTAECNIAITDSLFGTLAGYGLYKTGGGEVVLTNCEIAGFNQSAIYTEDVNLDIVGCQLYAENSDCIHAVGGSLFISSENGTEFSLSASGSWLRLEGDIVCDIFDIHLIGDNRASILLDPDNAEWAVFRVEEISGATEFFRYWGMDGYAIISSNPISINRLSFLPSQTFPITIILEEKYTLTPDVGIAHGTIGETTPATIFENDTAAVSLSPESGYYLEMLFYYEAGLPVTLYSHTAANYDFTSVNIVMPGQDVTVSAIFSPIPVSATMDDAEVDYPDTVTLTPSVTAYPGITYFYTWYFGSRLLTGEDDPTLSLTEVNQSGIYTVFVSNNIGAPETGVSAVVRIQPYGVATVWDSESSYTFNGSLQGPAASAKRLDDSDLPILVQNRSAQAGEHTLTAVSADSNYTLTDNTTVFTIDPLGVLAGWDAVTLFEYDGYPHKPSVQALDINNIQLQVSVYGGEINVSSTPYTAYAVPVNTNYFITNAYREFSIYPKTVNVQWSFNYTDDNLYLFFHTGYDQVAQISALYKNIFAYSVPLSVSVIGEETENEQFLVPDTYLVTADFLVPSPNYKLALDSTRVIIYPAKPVLNIPENDVVFLYDGTEHSLQYSYAYVAANRIVFKVNGQQADNAFRDPGVYSITISSVADAYHDAAPQVTATVRVLRTTVDLKGEDGVLIASASNAGGVDPLSALVVQSTPGSSSALDEIFTDAWGKTVLKVVNISLSGGDASISGDTVVKLKLSEDILSNKSLSLRCLRDGEMREVTYTVEDGYIVFTADALGEYVLVGDSLLNSVLGIGIIVIIITHWALIAIVIRRRRKI